MPDVMVEDEVSSPASSSTDDSDNWSSDEDESGSDSTVTAVQTPSAEYNQLMTAAITAITTFKAEMDEKIDKEIAARFKEVDRVLDIKVKEMEQVVNVRLKEVEQTYKFQIQEIRQTVVEIQEQQRAFGQKLLELKWEIQLQREAVENVNTRSAKRRRSHTDPELEAA
ncbi:unnamed protein product [Phytophthora fragariaefolia]|uniref:Unnamed protein product n=1 Tax=Phytophthora fragariaefolia TaxID=1490495 RepID=A0A9W7CTF3_9STRA|nr:unnamed protein product [Phytophthora fragariaefolia]